MVAAGINRYAGLLEYGGSGALTEENLPELVDACATGRNHARQLESDPNLIAAGFHLLAKGRRD